MRGHVPAHKWSQQHYLWLSGYLSLVGNEICHQWCFQTEFSQLYLGLVSCSISNCWNHIFGLCSIFLPSDENVLTLKTQKTKLIFFSPSGMRSLWATLILYHFVSLCWYFFKGSSEQRSCFLTLSSLAFWKDCLYKTPGNTCQGFWKCWSMSNWFTVRDILLLLLDGKLNFLGILCDCYILLFGQKMLSNKSICFLFDVVKQHTVEVGDLRI